MKTSNEWSDPSGLRRVISNGEAGNDNWPSASEQRRPKNTGIVNYETDADVTVLSSIPDTKQHWDKDYPGVGITGPAQDGPAVAQLRGKRR